LTVYLDTSVVVSLFTRDAHHQRALRLASTQSIVVSDLAAAEFASALAIHSRAGRMSLDGVRLYFAEFDRWVEDLARVEVQSSDVRDAERIIRLLQHSLKTADATHIAIARRLGAAMATFDQTMAREAERIGVTLAAL
jgi:uncharacterized protein